MHSCASALRNAKRRQAMNTWIEYAASVGEWRNRLSVSLRRWAALDMVGCWNVWGEFARTRRLGLKMLANKDLRRAWHGWYESYQEVAALMCRTCLVWRDSPTKYGNQLALLGLLLPSMSGRRPRGRCTLAR